MSTEVYKRLIEEFCMRHTLETAHVLAGGSILMEGVKFCLLYNAHALSPLMLMYCDFGPVPKDQQLYAYRKLLETNLTTYSGQGENFALTPEGRVVYTNNFILETLTAEVLTSQMAIAAYHATQWREGEFFANAAGKTAEREKFSAIFKQ